MPGALPHYGRGPASYQVSAAVAGGTLVVADGSSATTVSTAGAAAVNVLGYAGNDAAPIPNQAGNTDSLAGGAPILDISVVPDYTAVYMGPCDVHVTYAAAATFGALLMTAASGQVTPFTGSTYSQIIGRCTQPGGVAAGATVGRMRLFG